MVKIYDLLVIQQLKPGLWLSISHHTSLPHSKPQEMVISVSWKQKKWTPSCLGIITVWVGQDQSKHFLFRFGGCEVKRPDPNLSNFHPVLGFSWGLAAVAGSRVVLCPHLHQGRGEYPQVFSAAHVRHSLFPHFLLSYETWVTLFVPESLSLCLHKTTNYWTSWWSSGKNLLASARA